MIRKTVKLALIASLMTTALVTAPPAAAFIVYDPTNYAQNVLQAARALQQINNQIQQIENQATSLINETKNLTNLPFSTLETLQKQIDRTRQLLKQAERIAYSVADIDGAFASRYRGAALTGDASQMVANAKARWQDSVSAFEDSLKVGATLVGNLDDTRGSIDSLVSASQSATGALQAAQAGNQLLALQSQQLGDLTAAIAAQSKAQALESANGTATESEAQQRFKRFLGE